MQPPSCGVIAACCARTPATRVALWRGLTEVPCCCVLLLLLLVLMPVPLLLLAPTKGHRQHLSAGLTSPLLQLSNLVEELLDYKLSAGGLRMAYSRCRSQADLLVLIRAPATAHRDMSLEPLLHSPS